MNKFNKYDYLQRNIAFNVFSWYSCVVCLESGVLESPVTRFALCNLRYLEQIREVLEEHVQLKIKTSEISKERLAVFTTKISDI